MLALGGWGWGVGTVVSCGGALCRFTIILFLTILKSVCPGIDMPQSRYSKVAIVSILTFVHVQKSSFQWLYIVYIWCTYGVNSLFLTFENSYLFPPSTQNAGG
jgi:hypothetical protein